MNLRWDPCVLQSGETFSRFLVDFIDKPDRKCFVVGGAGFDPRAVTLPLRMGGFEHAETRGVFLREERLRPQKALRENANKHQESIQRALPLIKVKEISIFAEGKTIIGGRQAIRAVQSELQIAEITDVFIDLSALSTAVFFALVRHFLLVCDDARKQGHRINLHLVVGEQAKFDHKIHGTPGDVASLVHGYRGKDSLDANQDKALLWLPTLAPGSTNVAMLRRIHTYLSRTNTPIDVCPIIPFPGHDPRMPDKLIEEYREALKEWRADSRNFLHAAESDPLDAYRTICSIWATRERTFKDLGGSTVILSPLGNKLLAVGAMLAAIERDLPVALVEVVGYDEQVKEVTADSCDNIQMTHLWLAGDAYAEKSSTL